MGRRLGKLGEKLFHRFPNQKLKDASVNESKDVSQTHQYENRRSQDLWQVAYDKLDKNDKHILSLIQREHDKTGPSPTVEVLDQVIQTTKERYEEYRKGGLEIRRSRAEDINVRDTTQKILNATLSFKDTISAVVAFDPTGHSCGAWMIVSLGLTMLKNHNDLQNALFDSSEFLADILARFAYTERISNRDNNPGTKSEIKNGIVRVYIAILRYTAEVWKVQQAKTGRKLVESVIAITDQPLSKLKSSINDEEQRLQKWIQIDQHLQREKEAENILIGIDKMLGLIQDLHRKLYLSKLFVAEGSSFDSYIDQHEDICLPGTRIELLQQITRWAISSDEDAKCIYWLNGMAGTGKSTISRTVAKVFQESGILGASFFFKRGEGDRGSAMRLFSTITAQLITRIPQLVPYICQAIEDDPAIAEKSLRDQFKKLLLLPLLNLDQLDRPTTVVLVIDALDECQPVDDVQILLGLLPQLRQSTAVDVRVFLTSRPELPIQFAFENITGNDHQGLVLQEIPAIEYDITLFLNDRFSKIRKERSLPLNWPGDDKIQAVTKMAVPLFIFAATVCRFVGDRKWRPEKRLEDLLANPAVASASKMDRTYRPILEQLLAGQDKYESEKLMQEFQDIIGVIILLATPLSVDALSKLLDISKSDISNRLDSFHSVLTIPNDKDLPVRLLHLSFRDYLLDAFRRLEEGSVPFSVDEQEKHQRIAGKCLAVMRHSLRKNICNLPSDGTHHIKIHEQTIRQHLPSELQYSCRYWAQHLVRGKDLIPGMNNAFAFLQDHFLHWLEVMSILGIVSEVVDVIGTLQSSMLGEEMSTMLEFLHDAKRFVLKTRHIAEATPLQLYCSGLIFAPEKSIIRSQFKRELPSWVCNLPKVEECWSTELQTLEGHLDSVACVVFSPDFRLVASGSDDWTIKLWDISTGVLQQTLEGHSNTIRSIVFAPDGRSVVSGSTDKTIKLWDITTGVQQTFEGHSNAVQSVAISQDGQLIASGSSDSTIKLWDITGALQKTFDQHSGRVYSVTFSLDNQLLISSSDNTIKLWDIATGTLRQIFETHSDLVLCVACSQDGQLVASGSADKTIKLWDITTGVLQQTLNGHSRSVRSISFSSNTQLISGSGDQTIKVWDITTGILQRTLKGHSNAIVSVAISQDGQLVVSGSADKTVKLWDLTTEAIEQTVECHSSWVRYVAISPDGQLVASSSDDKTIKLWDIVTGGLQQTLNGHLNMVWIVIFSPNGQLIASGSADTTVRLWDRTTGALQKTFEGHSGWIRSIAFSPNNQLVASGSDDWTIKLWDISTGVLQQTLEGHSNTIRSTVFSLDGKLVASTSDDKTIKLWDVTTGALQQNLEVNTSVTNFNFSDNGAFLDSLQGSFTIQPWHNSQNFAAPQTNGNLYLEGEWVVHNDEQVLWLPPEYRPLCGAVKGGTLVLGHASGRVSLMRFNV
ncbi:hypothetical protein BGW36DRAFT_407989 [Talaromyces proteolyticus]|uniref:Nephrocystin 3-like N-terminal domain-containing protein n=1 Tax=Talaromyces proteolyticus TaxID=1131652 RepID=A0AAD4PV25_9EURO|nr:uncharacterized protein BGW36DRAFT_407989 [Talaromyces proteolyticus]KAH8696020.1 hypothetical protein BGW36DRAFT_407989 [Talaromyces proteolyticus]